jgi:hypothetical protein
MRQAWVFGFRLRAFEWRLHCSIGAGQGCNVVL